ncbi:MAG: GNAT family N-acetyltransferase [Corynebacterium sp.]|uniref:GNAT family N-acetyltransferase n=1 Tax=Corynebacterium sp. TaxID=1720 RepID=UPI003F948473
MEIRPLTVDDAQGVLPLLDQLGYPAGQEGIRSRIGRFLQAPEICCWVADGGGEDGDRLIGQLAGQLSWHIELEKPVARLSAIVVDEEARGQGVGQRLIGVFERWARVRGAGKMVLTSSTHREETHVFYLHLGWEATGLRFVKDLGPEA